MNNTKRLQKDIIRLEIEFPRDRSEIHATYADGTEKRAYRVKSSHLSGELVFDRLVKNLGLVWTNSDKIIAVRA